MINPYYHDYYLHAFVVFHMHLHLLSYVNSYCIAIVLFELIKVLVLKWDVICLNIHFILLHHAQYMAIPVLFFLENYVNEYPFLQFGLILMLESDLHKLKNYLIWRSQIVHICCN